MKIKKTIFSAIERTLNLIPLFRIHSYNRMVDRICSEVETKKIIKFYETIPLDEREKLFIQIFETTKSD